MSDPVISTWGDLPPAHDVDERQLSLLVKDWRRGRATRNIRQALSDGYVAVFTFVMVGTMVVSVIVKAQNVASNCATASCTSGRSLLPWAALAGVLALVLAACHMFGPVLASSAEGFWLLGAPIRRGKLLVRRLWLALGAALLVGLGVGALVAALTGSSGTDIIAWSVGTGLAAAGVTAFAGAEQGAERTWTVRTLQALVSLAGVAVLLMVVATAAGWADYRVGEAFGTRLAWGVGAVGLLLGIVGTLLATARLNRIRRAKLTSGGSLISGMQGAMFALDFGLVRDIMVERAARERGHVRPTRGRGYGLQALVWRDVQRLLRFPRPLLTLAVSAIVPYAVQALGIGTLNPPISAIVLMASLIPFFSALRVLSRTAGLARCLPYNTAQLRTSVAVVPLVLSALWCVAVVPGFMGLGSGLAHRSAMVAVQYSIVTALAGFIAAFRWVSAKSPDFSAPMVSTQMGAMPPGLAFNLIRGFDMVALITLPIVLGWSPWISLIIALLAFALLRTGGLNQQAMLDMQEEQKRQLEEQKAKMAAERQTEKIKVRRNR